MEIVSIPTDIVRTHERREENARKSRAAYEARTSRKNHQPRTKIPNSDRPFVFWDGEGPRDAGYALFGSSEGDEICHPYLSTDECLSLILDREREQPESIHIWFGSGYDVSMILKDIGWRHYNALKHWARTVWNDYEIEHIPGKWLKICRDGIVAKIYDICSFFGTAYVRALQSMGVGTAAEIEFLTSEKARRSEFVWAEIGDIRTYWRAELRLGPRLADKLRSAFVDAGFDVRSWHGPGSLANLAMRRNSVFDAMAETPTDVQIAARYAFAGGRFESFRGGWIRRKIYSADIRSAYPAFARRLPNLSRGTWRRSRQFEPGKFGVYRIRYMAPYDPLKPNPLFRRLASGEVVWENKCEGWYWEPEAALVSDDPHAEFLEALIFDEDDSTDRPFAWLGEYYERRQFLKSIGSDLQYTFKLIINSVYGQLAQRTGWDRKHRCAPRSHQLEWAGYITSACRASVYQVASRVGSNLVSIDTDGVYALEDFSGLDVGPDLGQWELESYDEGIFWQSGIYALREELGYDPALGYGWVKGKTRGITKGAYRPEDLIAALERGEPLRLTRTRFTGYGLALNGQRDRLNTWSTEDVELIFGGQGKRYHNAVKWCGRKGCADGIHEFIARPSRFSPRDNVTSHPHYLPWLGNDPIAEGYKRLIADETIFDSSDLDPEDEWVRNYDPA